MLIQIFDAAEDNELVSRNPARRSKIIRDVDGSLSQPRYEKDAFSAEEIGILRKELPNDLLGNSIRLLLDTGMRVQELIALSPEDIAEDGSLIDVNKAIKMVADIPQLGPPKSKSSKRVIPVPEESRNCAIFIREHGGKNLIWSLPGRNPYYSVRCFRRRYCNALRNIEGVRCLSPHCCRHTYVTRLQEKGVPMELIAMLAGHSDVVTTGGYAHTSVQTLAKAVSVL
jgi:integrase